MFLAHAADQQPVQLSMVGRQMLGEQLAAMAARDLASLRAQGLDDAVILDLNQIVAYFAYANRTVNGLGVEIAGEPLGLHPDEEQEGFAHG